MKTETLLTKLKEQNTVSREDIDNLLKSIGKPGEKRDDKLKAVQELGLANNQGHGIETTLEDYGSF